MWVGTGSMGKFNVYEFSENTRVTEMDWLDWPIAGKNPRTNCTPALVLAPKFFASRTDWMAQLPTGTCLGQVSLPGTHDSAAISKSLLPDLWANQSLTITEQLELGIRLFDIRISVEKGASGWSIKTGHGSHTFQDLMSVFQDMQEFLGAHKGESVVALFKIEHWNHVPVSLQPAALTYIYTEIFGNPELSGLFYNALANGKWTLPTLGQCSGQVVSLSRVMVDGGAVDQRFGAPVSWPDKTKGFLSAATDTMFSYYAQDDYSIGNGDTSDNRKKKAQTWRNAMNQPGASAIINFASARHSFLDHGYTNVGGEAMDIIGRATPAERPPRMGWCFYDDVDEGFYMIFPGWGIKKLRPVDINIQCNFDWLTVPVQFAYWQSIPEEGEGS